MTTITIWLLISVGNSHTQALVVERFATAQQCEEVRKDLPVPVGFIGIGSDRLTKCIRAEVAR